MLKNNTQLAEYIPHLRRLAIVLVCLILALVIGRLSMSDRLPLIAGGLIGVVVLVVLAFRLDWGVLALLVTTLFLKVGFSTGTQSPITLSLALTAALTASRQAARAAFLRVKIDQTNLKTPYVLENPVILGHTFAGWLRANR